MGDIRALLPVILHRRAVRRATAAEPAAVVGARGVTAAVVGVIANLALWFAVNAFFAESVTVRFAGAVVELPQLTSASVSSLLITLAAAVLVFRLNASVMVVLAGTGLLGVATILV